MDKCPLCGGNLEEELLDTGLSGFKVKVKTFKCKKCGEDYMENLKK